MNYIHPDYESLKPRRLKETIRDLSNQNVNLISRRHSISPEELFYIPISNIENNPKLIKLCSYYLNHISVQDKRSEYVRVLVNYLKLAPKNFTQIYKQLFYRFLENTDDLELKSFLINSQLIVKGRFKKYIDSTGFRFFNSDYSLEISNELIQKIVENNSAELGVQEIEQIILVNDYRLLTSYRSYQNVINDYVIKIIGYKTFFDNQNHFGNIIDNVIHEANKKRIFERIIERIPTDRYKEERFDFWIKYVHKELGNPYDETRYKWIGIKEEAKRKFNQWIVNEKIILFFDRKDPSKRVDFWKKYAYDILRLEYVEEANKAVLMFTSKNQIMVEFLAIGNAFYIYQLDDLEDFERYLKNLELMRATNQTSSLKGANSLRMITNVSYKNHNGGWIHTSPTWHWEERFETNLKQLGYKAR